MTGESHGRGWRITCVSARGHGATALAQVVSTLWPDALVESADLTSVRSIPTVDCAIFDANASTEDAVSAMRDLRARGVSCPMILVTSDEVDEARREKIKRIGATVVSLDEIVMALPPVMHEAVRARTAEHTSAELQAAVRALQKTRRLLAAGEIALGLQHALNNPLAALLAEAQLLELEELTPDHRQSVERIVELCRRVVDVVRSLDGVGRSE